MNFSWPRQSPFMSQSNPETTTPPYELRQSRRVASSRTVGKFSYGAAARAKEANTSDTPPLFWLHIPKCGTSFGTSVASYPTHPTRDLSQQHQALSVVQDESQLRAVVGLFRNPDQRLLSSFYWIKKEKTCCTRDWGWLPNVYVPVRNQIREGAPEALISKFKGCQTNMILGEGCMARGPGMPPHTHAEVNAAKERLEIFRFVGLQEEWRTSICLFNYISTGRRFVAPKQLGRLRPGMPLHEHASAIDGSDTTAARGPETAKNASAIALAYSPKLLGPQHFDAADTAIYEAAKARFHRECSQFDIQESTCPLEEL